MPIHLDNLDVISEASGLSSVLIVPCNMCPAVTVAVKEKRPFIRFFRSFLKSDPFEQHIKVLQSRLRDVGVNSEVFRSDLPHQWFVCMWTWGRRKRLQNRAKKHEAVVVLGCDTANETVRDAVKSTGCKVIEGMEVAGFMNAKMKLHWPGNVCFEDCKVIPITHRNGERSISH